MERIKSIQRRIEEPKYENKSQQEKGYFSDLIVLPGAASMVHTQCRLCSYGAGYPGDRIRPEGSSLIVPPHSAKRRTESKMRKSIGTVKKEE